MQKNRLPIIVWLVSLLMCIVLVANSRFTADMSAFLPKSPSAEQMLLVDQLTTGALSRTLLIGIEADNDEGIAQLDSLSVNFARRLRESGKFAFIVNGDSRDFAKDQALLMQYRYLLSSNVTPALFTLPRFRSSLYICFVVEQGFLCPEFFRLEKPCSFRTST